MIVAQIGIDLSAEYLALTERRLHGKTMGLALGSVESAAA